MQKAWNIISVIVILGLGVWIFFLIRANMQWKQFVQSLPKRITTADTTVQTSTVDTPQQKSITGAELWEQFKNQVNEMTIDLKFNNNQ